MLKSLHTRTCKVLLLNLIVLIGIGIFSNIVLARDAKKYLIIEAKGGKKPGEFGIAWKPPEREEWEPVGPKKFVVDSKENIYIGDSANHRIQKFDPKGNLLLVIEEIKYVSTMIVDFKDNLIVGDGGDCIKKFNSKGELLLKFGEEGKYGEKGGDKQFLNIITISVDPEGNIYVEDRTGPTKKPICGCRIRKFSPKGELIKDFEGVSRKDSPPLFDKKGNRYKILFEKVRRGVNRYSALQKINSQGVIVLQIDHGFLIGVDAKQNIYLYGSTRSRREILKYDKEGNLGERILLPSLKKEIGKFTTRLQMDPNGNIYDMEVFYMSGPKQGVKVIKYQ